MISLEGGILLERFLEPPRPRKFGPWGLKKNEERGNEMGEYSRANESRAHLSRKCEDDATFAAKMTISCTFNLRRPCPMLLWTLSNQHLRCLSAPG